MRPHQSSGTVACLVAAALLCSSVVLAGTIVFPEANDLPVIVEDAAAAEGGRRPEQPAPGTAGAAEAATLSPCVWAIVSCCDPGQSLVRTRCFELLGCGGHFWDASPCSDQLAWAAVRAAASFYQATRYKSP